ncbi:hypothetical protein [Acinetobacter sp. YH01024]|uniref:hypothetical protein n=1 Tax=Acinetobacter sp. YH01024 TaxID=2601037 RepID=UPI00211ED6DA|nr:hypothetical protein [Acinetobacter sp. YH01024]
MLEELMLSDGNSSTYNNDFYILVTLIFLPFFVFLDGLTLSLFNFFSAILLASCLICYYFLAFRYNKIYWLKIFLLIIFLSIYLFYFLFFFSFLYNKNNKWSDVSVDNFKKPLIVWIEDKLKELKEDKNLQANDIKVDITEKKEQIEYVEDDYYEEDYDEVVEYEDDESYSDESYNYSSSNSGYHSVEGYTRSDGTEVGGYVRGNPDGIEENNIEYMRDHGDQNGLEQAYSFLD